MVSRKKPTIAYLQRQVEELRISNEALRRVNDEFQNRHKELAQQLNESRAEAVVLQSAILTKNNELYLLQRARNDDVEKLRRAFHILTEEDTDL